MKKLNCSAISMLLITSFALFVSAHGTKKLTVSGTVLDSVTDKPITQAMVILLGSETLIPDTSNLSNLKFDTTATDNDGKFKYEMTVSANVIIVFCIVIKQNYLFKYTPGIPIPVLNTVNFGTIKLSPTGITQKDTLTVSGIVVDSATGKALEGALVNISSLTVFDTAGNSMLSGVDGKFSKIVIIAKSSALLYIVSKLTYLPSFGQKPVTGKLVDLGTIGLRKNSISIIPGNTLFSSQKTPTSATIYTLNGQLLYSGSIKTIDMVIKRQSTPVIVNMKCDNAVITSKKFVPGK